jgi:peptide/nickel transport system permease protein
MFIYLVKRLLEMIPTLFGITLISFFIIHLAPGKPTDIYAELNPKITPEAREKLNKYYGLDKPIIVQYGIWLKRIAKLDFGESFSSDRRPVMEKIWDTTQPFYQRRLFVTFMINLLAMIIIFLIAIPIGISSSARQNSLYDRAMTTTVFIGFAIPSFWLALLLMIYFGVHLHWLPIAGLKSMDFDSLSMAGKVWDIGKHLLLPLFVSAFGGLAGTSRFMRSSMLEVIRQDYITVARAKGLPEKKVIYRHAMRNALLPIITLMGSDRRQRHLRKHLQHPRHGTAVLYERPDEGLPSGDVHPHDRSGAYAPGESLRGCGLHADRSKDKDRTGPWIIR